jgi:hypothetical protein
MMLKSLVTAGALLVASLGMAGATTVTVDVQSAAHSSATSGGLATGVVLALGQTFSVSADPQDTWSLGSNDPGCTRESNADGLTACFGNYTQGNLSTLYGTLVGRIGGGDFFALGSSFTGMASAAGELFLFNWDSNDSDNSGSIAATISAVPLPAGGLLLLGAMGGLAALRRRKTA